MYLANSVSIMSSLSRVSYLDNLNKIYLRLNTDREKYYRVKSAEVSLTKHPRHFSTMELSLNTFIYIYIVHGIYNIQYLLIGTNE